MAIDNDWRSGSKWLYNNDAKSNDTDDNDDCNPYDRNYYMNRNDDRNGTYMLYIYVQMVAELQGGKVNTV